MKKMTENLNALVDRAMQESKYTQMRPVLMKELLHYDILFSLDRAGLLGDLTFQGGTSLRLCYGAYRFSEDLDFVGGLNFSTDKLHGIKECIEKYIGDRYGLEVSVKEPNELRKSQENADIFVDKWQVSIVTSPERKDLPKQKIKLEIANIPAYSRVPKSLQKNYDFLPDGYEDMLIMVESLDEILADKIVSLPNCQRYIRNRDIWDLRWLKQQGAQINIEFILNKIANYKVNGYQEKLNKMIERMSEIVHGKPFIDEMSRFIPLDILERTLYKANFLDHLANENKGLLFEVSQKLFKQK